MRNEAKGREQAEPERHGDIGRSRGSNFENNEQGYLFIEPRAMRSFYKTVVTHGSSRRDNDSP